MIGVNHTHWAVKQRLLFRAGAREVVEHMVTADLYCLSITALNRLGFFGIPIMPGFIDPQFAAGDWWVEFPGCKLRVRLTRRDGIEVHRIGTNDLWMVQLAYVELRHGLRLYFKCGCCGQLRNELFVVRGELICGSHFVSRPDKLGKRTRDHLKFIAKNRFAAIARARDAPTADQKLDTVRDKAARKAARAARPKRPPKPSIRPDMKTRYAIDNGRGGAFDDLHLEYVAEPKDHWLMIGLDVAYERPSYVDTLEHYPELDIDKLRLPSMAEQGGVFSRTLQWGERGPSGTQAHLFYDWREHRLLVMACLDPRTSDQRWQQLPVSREGSGRYRWDCPVTYDAVGKLYYRDGLFASRHAHRLVNASQRAAGRHTSNAKE